MAQLGKYDLIDITETWRDRSHDWNTLIEDYRLFRGIDRVGGVVESPSVLGCG